MTGPGAQLSIWLSQRESEPRRCLLAFQLRASYAAEGPPGILQGNFVQSRRVRATVGAGFLRLCRLTWEQQQQPPRHQRFAERGAEAYKRSVQHSYASGRLKDPASVPLKF